MMFFVNFKYGKLNVGELYTTNSDFNICKITHAAYFIHSYNYRFEGEVVTYNG